MRFSVLSSGSKANCTFLEVGSTRILIDCGLSGRQVEQRLIQHGIAPDSLDAILVTHEHSDHIRGVKSLSLKYKLPVYLNAGARPFVPEGYAVEEFVTGEAFQLGAMQVRSFSIVHDAHEPVGFVVEGEGLRFAQATDLGRVTPIVRFALQDCHAIVLESNHDSEMLQTCNYPWELKQRIASTHGHLSNDSAGAFLAELMTADLNHIVLGHLSENSNTPEIALMTARQYLRGGHPSLRCGSIAHPTPLVHVGEPVIASESLELCAAG